MKETDKDSKFTLVTSDEKEGSKLEILFVQTSNMQRILGQYPDIVNLDGTYCINNLGFPCYVFMVADGEGTGSVVAYALVKDETTTTLTSLLKEFNDLNPNVKIKTFIVDKDAAEIAAIKAVFPDTNIILCRFHVSNNFKDANSKYSKNCSAQDKDNNLKSLNRMLTTTVEDTFYKSLNTHSWIANLY